ncbi:lipopolysaccharide assembly protein LapA domain-containing protein [Porticoccus sp. W117]|uniref:lipopolysaccharide assembly protein LapA domain-containing protein n=1 Tax=Porticoccus sp. W117 TaxID=3054777 RepID=UPI002591C59B|nr:lipopolysaccharide assembly protein LapA domain-containing protein [Porticoccus sp. W117]MDM3872084.1 lipopolysaccharide assembly protein LapA domain-containing protein [Porticoccus sp. W117]
MALLKKILLYISLLVVLLLGIWIGRDNTQEVSFILLGFQLPGVELGMFVALLFILFVSFGTLLTLPSMLKHRHAAKRYRQKLLAAEVKLSKQQQ